MSIPSVPKYPDEFDGINNLYLVHDSLRVKLVEDYLPGQTSIVVSGDLTNFPPTGIITLTEQQSEIDKRAVSFYYSEKTGSGFSNLELLPGFVDVAKPKDVTNVTQNVMDVHHNNLKDVLIAIEKFIGIKDTKDDKPLGETMEGRINFLRELVLRPRAWFNANKRIGIVPLTVEFKDESFRNPTSWCWNFGDGTTPSTVSCETISVSVISTPSNYLISDAETHTVSKTFYNPGIYDITLKVSNLYGEDEITIPNFIIARVAAPDEATLSFAPDNATQSYIANVLKTRTNSVVDVEVFDNGEQDDDPVTSYEWDMQDDLSHLDAVSTKGSYSVGGFYDIRVKAKTQLGAYRTTIFRNVIDVIEKSNLWMLISPDTSAATTKTFYAYEMGLISETIKVVSRNSVSVTRNTSDVNTSPNASQKVAEWKRNAGFCQRNRTQSGDKGSAVVYWTEGTSPSIHIKFKEYTGFSDTWVTPTLDTLDRGWNWVSFNASNYIYFVLGTDVAIPTNTPGSSPTNQLLQKVSLNSLTTSTLTLDVENYRNGAEELMQNTGFGNDGDYSVYRSCFKDHTGFLLRNDGVGAFFRIKSFYRTEGTLAEEFQYFRKLPDMPGTQKLEGQLVTLTNGVYFFNNSGEIAVWNDTSNVWSVGGPGNSSTPFRTLQDQTVAGFDDPENDLVVASDLDRRAYLSFNYSTKVFLKFTESTLSFSSLPVRPTGEQLLVGVY
jgi:PKD repeat protein